MKKSLCVFFLCLFLLCSCVSDTTEEVAVLSEDGVVLSKSDAILQKLRSGNSLFADQQNPLLPPLAEVYYCSDMKVSPEILFQTFKGELFTVSLSGYEFTDEVIGSLEEGVIECHTEVLVILAHKNCTYIKQAINMYYGKGHLHNGFYRPMLEYAFPVIEEVIEQNPRIEGSELIPYVTVELVWKSVRDLFIKSFFVMEQYYSGELRIVAAVYDSDTGEVLWLPEGSIKDLYNEAVIEKSDL